MKRLIRKIAEFFGIVAKQPTQNYKLNSSEDNQNFLHKETPLSFDSMPITEKPIDYGVKTKEIKDVKLGKIVIISAEEIKRKTTLPKDASNKQFLDKKFNNPNTVYRNNKGRFASLKK